MFPNWVSTFVSTNACRPLSGSHRILLAEAFRCSGESESQLEVGLGTAVMQLGDNIV
jgi:hypothetical protein